MKKYGMRDWEGKPEGFKASGLEAEVPRLPPPPPKNSLLQIKVLGPSSAVVLDKQRPSQALVVHRQHSQGQPQVGSQHWCRLKLPPRGVTGSGSLSCSKL